MKDLKLDKQTMTLKEITDLLKVRHNDAMKTVTLMIGAEGFGSITECSYRTSRGNIYTTYQLDKRQSLAVAARLNVTLLMRIIDRWQELENATPPQPQLPATYIEALSAHLESEKALLESQAERKRIEERFLSVMDKEGAYTFLETSKLLSTHGHSGLGRTTLMHLLRSKGLLLKSNLPAQQQIVNGRFIVKRYYIEEIAKHGTSTLVTPKGFVFISRHINNWLN